MSKRDNMKDTIDDDYELMGSGIPQLALGVRVTSIQQRLKIIPGPSINTIMSAERRTLLDLSFPQKRGHLP